MNIPQHGCAKMRKKERKGIVQQVTPKLIAIKGEKYPETILVNDLISGEAEIICLKIQKREVNMAKKKLLIPTKEELQGLFEKHNGVINKISAEIGWSWPKTKQLIVDAGIINNLGQPGEEPKQTPTLEPETVGSHEPDEGLNVQDEEAAAYSPAGESALNIIPEPVKMPIGCALPLEQDTTEPPRKEMPNNDMVEIQINWPPKDAAERALMESSINAQLAVRRVIDDPVALTLIKELIAQGAV